MLISQKEQARIKKVIINNREKYTRETIEKSKQISVDRLKPLYKHLDTLSGFNRDCFVEENGFRRSNAHIDQCDNYLEILSLIEKEAK